MSLVYWMYWMSRVYWMGLVNCMMRCIWIVGIVRRVRVTLIHFRMFILVRLLVRFWMMGWLIPVWLVIRLLMGISRSWLSMISWLMGMNWSWFTMISWLMGMNWSWFTMISRLMGMNWSGLLVIRFRMVSRLMVWTYWSLSYWLDLYDYNSTKKERNSITII